MDLRKLKTLLELFDQSNLQEMEFCEGEERVRLKKPKVASDKPAGAGGNVAATGNDVASMSDVSDDIATTGTVVKAPMVGTFYRAPAPDKPPFVRVGQKIEAGATLCVIEAMKLMNEIPSPISGEIKEVIAENGEPVAFGNKLFVIE